MTKRWTLTFACSWPFVTFEEYEPPLRPRERQFAGGITWVDTAYDETFRKT
jgi:hypothetical protein